MKAIRFFCMILVAVILGGWLTLRFLTVDLPVGTVGVRTQEYGVLGTKGVVPKDFGPGWHRDLWIIDSWTLFDSTVQTLEMTRDPRFGDRKERDDIQVQSADGYRVSVDVTVKYRIMAGKAHLLYQDTGSQIRYKSIVRNESQQACMAVFGGMETEDFYNPSIRRQKADSVQEALSQSLADNYVDVIHVLIRDVQFDPEYEEKIRRKKLADQEVEVNKSMAKSAEMAGKTQVIEAETERMVKVIQKEQEAELIRMQAETDREIATVRAEAERYATEKQADADLVESKMKARGELLVRTAEAQGEKLRNRAMMGVGGSTIVALEAAKNLSLTSMVISTMEVDVLDLDAMATKLGVPEGPATSQARPAP